MRRPRDLDDGGPRAFAVADPLRELDPSTPTGVRLTVVPCFTLNSLLQVFGAPVPHCTLAPVFSTIEPVPLIDTVSATSFGGTPAFGVNCQNPPWSRSCR